MGQQIRAKRTLAGKSQTELANAIDVKFQQIQKYESGKNRVSASRLWMIAESLSVDIADFFPGGRDSADQYFAGFTQFDLLLLRTIKDMDERKKSAFIRLIGALSEENVEIAEFI